MSSKTLISSDPQSEEFFWNHLSDERKYELVRGSSTNEMWNTLPSGLRDSLIANFKKKKKVKSNHQLQLVTQTQQKPKPEPLVPPPVMNIEQDNTKLNEPLVAPVMSF